MCRPSTLANEVGEWGCALLALMMCSTGKQIPLVRPRSAIDGIARVLLRRT